MAHFRQIFFTKLLLSCLNFVVKQDGFSVFLKIFFDIFVFLVLRTDFPTHSQMNLFKYLLDITKLPINELLINEKPKNHVFL